MPQKYNSDQFWKLYENLSQELKDVLFAEETGNNIYDICKRYGVSESLDQVVDYVGQTLLGVLSPNDFQETIEKELKIEKEVAKRIATEIYRYILYPVKKSLEELYRIEIAPLAKMPVTPPSSERPPTPSTKEDVYREPVEEKKEE